MGERVYVIIGIVLQTPIAQLRKIGVEIEDKCITPHRLVFVKKTIPPETLTSVLSRAILAPYNPVL